MGAKNKRKHYDVGAVKKRLSGYRELDHYIENQVERYEALKTKMYCLGAQELTDMPKAPGTVRDRTGIMVAQKEELEKRIKSLIEKRSEEYRWIKDVLAHLSNADEVTIIECRYLDGDRWKDIAKILYGSKQDYDEKEDSYVRYCAWLHGRALVNIAAYEQGESRDCASFLQNL